MLNLNPNW